VPEVFVGLGSNVGDRAAHLRAAVHALAEVIAIERVSSVWLTEPVGLREQAPFYNAALGGRSALEPRALLDAMIAIEERLGRRRVTPMGPRAIDLDLLLYDDLAVVSPGLVLPHPRMAARRFVLAPLAEIAPLRRIGKTAGSVADVLAELEDTHGVERLALEAWPPTLD
jgi:2-amino-4-hydroxy-6-hydroxymethyldihydropteridine diphosphokinase